MRIRFELRPASVEELRTAFEAHFRLGKAFIPDVNGHEPFTPCTVTIHHPHGGDPIVVGGTVMSPLHVQVDEGGVEIMLDDGLLETLREFTRREPPRSGSEAKALSPALRLKPLTMNEKLKLARTSASLTDRTALERMLDRSGWEALLQNPRITIPEIARIARKGTVPRPLIEQIVDNGRWSRNATVRRALLSNPKLTRGLVLKILRQTPRHELKLVPKQTAYPPLVRSVAKELLG
ncbi:MAG: hypothetical protein AAGF12_23165 [Myxococcota bacterium]